MEDRVVPFLKYRYIAIALSAALFVALIVISAARGGLMMGVDFVGGQKIIASFEKGVDEAAIRKALRDFNPTVQQVGEPEDNQYIISTKLSEDSVFLARDQIVDELEKKYPRAEISRDEAVLLSFKGVVTEQMIAAQLAGIDAAIQKIGEPGRSLYAVYRKESTDRKKTTYGSDDVEARLKTAFRDMEVLSGFTIIASFDRPVEASSIEALLKKKYSISVLPILNAARPTHLIYRVAMDESERISVELAKNFKKAEILSVENVGPAVGSYLRQSALKLIAVAILLMSIYLAYRFEIRYSIGAMVAVLHDVALATAFCGAAGVEINIPVIAALLTIFGYSVNDTIVIFDRIRESTQIMTKSSFVEIINKSITFTMSRTILTSLLTLFTVFALFLIGGEGISDFAKVLLFGMIVGIYSTVYIASPVVLGWEWMIKKIRS